MKTIFIVLLLVTASFLIAEAQSPEWYYIRPDKTGIAGDYHQVVRNDCKGNIWTAGYMPFWADGSVVRFNYADTIFTCWGNYDGYLPADRVYDIAFDNTNGVWVATNGVGTGGHGGIAHYDGSTWTQYTSLNTPMPEDHMRGITVDGNNTVWATFDNITNSVGGIAKFNGNTWTIYTPSNSNLPTARVYKIIADTQNNIWIGTEIGLVKFDGQNWVLYLSGKNVTDVEYDASTNKIYAATGGAIDIYDGTSWSQINSSNSPVSASNLWAVDAHGDTLIIGALASVSGCWIYNGTSWTTHVSPNHVYDVRIDHHGKYWVCGIGFLEKFDGTSWTRYTRYNTGLVDYFNNQIFVDSKNRKWFANSDGGIQIFDCPHWEDYGPYNGGLFPSLQNMTPIGTSITEDSYGDIWMTYDGVLGYAIQIPGGAYKNYASWVLWDITNTGGLFQSPLETKADDTGHVFMRLYSGAVQMYSHSTNSWIHLDAGNSGLPPGGLHCMAPRAGGKMYFGGFMFIYILDNGAWSTIDFAALGLPIMDVYDIAFDHNNYMWLATDHGVYKYDGTTWTNWTKANSNIAADHVTSIAFGNADTVFIGAHNTQTAPYYGGISVYNGTSWTSFLEGSSPIPHKQVEDIEIDTLGNLWILTQSEGITVYKKGGVIGFNCIDRNLQSCNVILSVNLLELKAAARPGGIQVSWKVSNEENMNKYEVGKSIDGRSFVKIGEVVSGNSMVLTNYSFLDVNPNNGLNFYRLTMVDIDGNKKYSTIVFINLKTTGKLSMTISPNPSNTQSTVHISGNLRGKATITAYDVSGRMITNLYSGEIDSNAFSTTLNLSILKRGIYILKLVINDESVISKLIIE